MGLLICCACDRQREISPINRNIGFCSNCGAKKPRIIYRRKIWKNWEENVGIIKIEALRRTYAGLKWLQENKQFNPKYPLAKFKGIFGLWPPDEITEVPPYAPTSNLLWWLERANQQWRAARRLEEKLKAPEITLRLPPEPMEQIHADPSLERVPSFMTPEDWEVKL